MKETIIKFIMTVLEVLCFVMIYLTIRAFFRGNTEGAMVGAVVAVLLGAPVVYWYSKQKTGR